MIRVAHVSKTYAQRKVLDDVSLVVPDGSVSGFVGPNGAGKSTLLRIVCGLTHPDSGTVDVDGRPFVEAPAPGAALGAFLSAETIPEHLTAESFLRYVCDLQQLPRRRTGELLELVGLAGAERRRVKTFSLGMRQRLGIAAAIAGRPRNLVLDEPINGLDPDGILWLRAFVRSVADQGGAVLLSSHHMSELAQVADAVTMLDGGSVVRAGAIGDFVADEVVRTYFAARDRDEAVQLLRSRGYAVSAHGPGAVVEGAAPEEVGGVLFREGGGAFELRRLERSLEETYFDEIAARQKAGGRSR